MSSHSTYSSLEVKNEELEDHFMTIKDLFHVSCGKLCKDGEDRKLKEVSENNYMDYFVNSCYKDA